MYMYLLIASDYNQWKPHVAHMIGRRHGDDIFMAFRPILIFFLFLEKQEISF